MRNLTHDSQVIRSKIFRRIVLVTFIAVIGFVIGYFTFGNNDSRDVEHMPVRRSGERFDTIWGFAGSDCIVYAPDQGPITVYQVLGHVYVAQATKIDNEFEIISSNWSSDKWNKFKSNNKMANRFSYPCKLELRKFNCKFIDVMSAMLFSEIQKKPWRESRIHVLNSSQSWIISDESICRLEE
jgi:hypothetical protein